MKPLTETQKKLVEKGILDLAGKIDAEMAEYVRSAIPELIAYDAPPLTVFISSSGGDVHIGLSIYDMLNAYPNTTTGIVVIEAKSMAAVILQACTIRKALTNSEILIHHISRSSVSLDIIRDAKKLEKVAKGLEMRQSKINKILADRTKKSIEEIRRVCELNREMNVEEAIEFGLVDSVYTKEERITS
jgi:ATP-dependent Clp protease protease subunit